MHVGVHPGVLLFIDANPAISTRRYRQPLDSSTSIPTGQWSDPRIVYLGLLGAKVGGQLAQLEVPPDLADAPWVRWVHAGLYALMMWGFVLGFLGLFVRHCRGRSAVWRYVADASYWIYLVHLPLVVWLQILVGRWPLHWSVKFPLVVLVAMPVLFLSYHFTWCVTPSSGRS